MTTTREFQTGDRVRFTDGAYGTVSYAGPAGDWADVKSDDGALRSVHTSRITLVATAPLLPTVPLLPDYVAENVRHHLNVIRALNPGAERTLWRCEQIERALKIDTLVEEQAVASAQKALIDAKYALAKKQGKV